MTDREKAIVMAYTGYTMLKGDKLDIFYRYVEEKLGSPVYTHELADKATQKLLKQLSKNDFIELCRIEENKGGNGNGSAGVCAN